MPRPVRVLFEFICNRAHGFIVSCALLVCVCLCFCFVLFFWHCFSLCLMCLFSVSLLCPAFFSPFYCQYTMNTCIVDLAMRIFKIKTISIYFYLLAVPPCFTANWIFPIKQGQFSSVQDGIYALGKDCMRATPSLRCFPIVGFETVPMLVWLTVALSSFQGRSSSASKPLSAPLSSKRSMVWCPWFCAHM